MGEVYYLLKRQLRQLMEKDQQIENAFEVVENELSELLQGELIDKKAIARITHEVEQLDQRKKKNADTKTGSF